MAASGGSILAKKKPVIRVLREAWADPSVGLPAYETPGAAGADIRANLRPEDRETGLAFRMRPGTASHDRARRTSTYFTAVATVSRPAIGPATMRTTVHLSSIWYPVDRLPC